MCLPPGLCLGPHREASSASSWQTLGLTIAEGPTELRAPGPRDPTIRHCVWDKEIPPPCMLYGMETVNKMTQCECSNWRQVSGVVCDKEIPPPPCMLNGMETVNKMTQCECSNWREVSGVVCDKEIPPPCMLYGMETVNKMTQCECSNWREVSGVVCDKEIPPPCMLYGMEK